MPTEQLTVEGLYKKGREKNWFYYAEDGFREHLVNILRSYQQIISSITGQNNGILEFPGRNSKIIVPDPKPFVLNVEGVKDFLIPLGLPINITFPEGEDGGSQTIMLDIADREGNYEGTELRVYGDWMIKHDSYNQDKQRPHITTNPGELEAHLRNEAEESARSHQQVEYAILIQQEGGVSMSPDIELDWSHVINKPDAFEIIGIENNFLSIRIKKPITIQTQNQST